MGGKGLYPFFTLSLASLASASGLYWLVPLRVGPKIAREAATLNVLPGKFQVVHRRQILRDQQRLKPATLILFDALQFKPAKFPLARVRHDLIKRGPAAQCSLDAVKEVVSLADINGLFGITRPSDLVDAGQRSYRGEISRIKPDRSPILQQRRAVDPRGRTPPQTCLIAQAQRRPAILQAREAWRRERAMSSNLTTEIGSQRTCSRLGQLPSSIRRRAISLANKNGSMDSQEKSVLFAVPTWVNLPAFNKLKSVRFQSRGRPRNPRWLHSSTKRAFSTGSAITRSAEYPSAARLNASRSPRFSTASRLGPRPRGVDGALVSGSSGPSIKSPTRTASMRAFA